MKVWKFKKRIEIDKTIGNFHIETKDFCNKKTSCTRCPFRVKVSQYDDTCMIKYPNSWDKEKVKENYLDKKARREYELILTKERKNNDK